MDTRVIPLSDIDASDVAKWHDLADNALEPNLCLEPDTLLSIVSHNLAGPELRLVVSERDDRFEACVGVQQRQWRTRASRRVVTSRPDAHPTPLLPRLGVPLVREGGGAEAVGALLSTITSLDQPRGAHVLDLERVWKDGPVAALVREACANLELPLHTLEEWDLPILQRREQDGYRTSSWSRHQRRKIKRRRRQLADVFDAPVQCVDRSDDPRAVDDLMALEQAGWKGKAGTAIRNDVDRAGFLRAVCERFRSRSKLHLLSLEADGVNVAMKCCMSVGPTFFIMRSAYDERYRRFGPGVLLAVATAEYFDSSTAALWMDPCCSPTNVLYPRLLPDRKRMCRMMIAGDRLGSRVLLAGLPRWEAMNRRLGTLRDDLVQVLDRRTVSVGGSRGAFRSSLMP
jgi:hypothetical protein